MDITKDWKIKRNKREFMVVLFHSHEKRNDPIVVRTTVDNIVIFKRYYMDGYSKSIFFREIGRVVYGYYDKSITVDENGNMDIRRY